MWYQFAKEAVRARKTHNKTEPAEPRTTDGETERVNMRPNTPPDDGQNKDGMNRPNNVRYGHDEDDTEGTA